MQWHLKFLRSAVGVLTIAGTSNSFAQNWPCPARDPLQMPEFCRYELAESVEFPVERVRTDARGIDHRVVLRSVTHPPGHAVELLTDAGPGAQIRDPVTGLVVWVPRNKLGPEVESAPPEPEAEPFQVSSKTSNRPIRFPLRQPNGQQVGSITLPAGEPLRIVAEKGDYVRVETDRHFGWVLKSAMESDTSDPATALANIPAPRPTTKNPATDTGKTDTAPPPLIPFETSDGHVYRELVPLGLTARVLGRRKYPIPGQTGGFWGTEVMPLDLALVWGPFLHSDRLRVTEMGYRSASFAMQHREIGIFSGNFPIVVDDPEVRKKLDSIQVGDLLVLKGALVRIEHPRGRADPFQSTTTGSYCYNLLLRSFDKMKQPLASNP